MKFILKVLLVLFVLSWLPSCVSPPNYSTTPEIEFSEIRKIYKTINNDLLGEIRADSVIISINFKDGDGNIGLTNGQMKGNLQYAEFSNFIVRTFIQVNGEYQYADINPPLGGLINFELLPNQKPGPIEGTINYSTIFLYDLYSGYSPLFKPQNDTLKFEIQLIDNDFNQSNTIVTEPIVIFQN